MSSIESQCCVENWYGTLSAFGRQMLHLVGEIVLKTKLLKKTFIASLALSVSCFFACDDDEGKTSVAIDAIGASSGSDNNEADSGTSGLGAVGDIGNPEGAGGTGDAGTEMGEDGPEGADGAGDAADSLMGPSCEDFTPCGGNAAGEWNFEAECLHFVYPEPDDFCPDGSLEYLRTPLGTLSLRMDSTVTFNYGFRAQFITTLPAACLNGMTCEQLEASYNPDPDGAYPTICAVDEDIAGCVCTDTFEQEPSSVNGMWEPLRGHNILMTFEDDSSQIALFCVEGDTLLMQPLEDEDDPGLGPVFSLTRQ